MNKKRVCHRLCNHCDELNCPEREFEAIPTVPEIPAEDMYDRMLEDIKDGGYTKKRKEEETY